MALRLIIIGSGPGGYHAAIRAAHLGAKVTLIEVARIGGTCLHKGCIPTKTLLTSARVLLTARRAQEYGLRLNGIIIPDLPSIIARKNQIVTTQERGIKKLLKDNNIDLIQGRAQLLEPSKIGIRLNDGSFLIKEYDRLILATGSRPSELSGLTQDGIHILNSDHALSLQNISTSLVIIGGGVIGCEIACIYAAFGSQVTIIEALDRLLPIPSLDYDCSKLLLREMKKSNISVYTSKIVDEVTKDGKKLKLTLLPSSLEKRNQINPVFIWTNKIIVTIGRAINSEKLGLIEAGIALDSHKAVIVDSFLSAAPKIWAIGDLLGTNRPMLAHMASAEGVIAAEIALGHKKKLDYSVVPTTVFTFPEVAWVGITLEQALQQGIHAQATSFPIRLLGKAHTMNEIVGQCKLISEKKSGQLLGAHLIGPHASDLINECALALKLKATLNDIANTIHAHPTLAECIKETAEIALSRSIILPPPSRFNRILAD